MPLDDATRLRRAAVFGRAADVYDRHRTGYPDDAVTWAVPADARDVVDLGAGTGKLTAALAARGSLHVTAVDPSPEMLDRLRASVPGVATRVASAEATGLPTASADVVAVAAAFHWFSRPAADEEIARVLRPGGTLAVLTDRRDPEGPAARLFTAVGERLRAAGEQPSVADEEFVPDPRWFGPAERAEFRHDVVVTVPRLVGMIASRSYVIDLPEPARTDLLDEVGRLARAEFGAGDDATAVLPLRTVVWRAQTLRS